MAFRANFRNQQNDFLINLRFFIYKNQILRKGFKNGLNKNDKLFIGVFQLIMFPEWKNWASKISGDLIVCLSKLGSTEMIRLWTELFGFFVKDPDDFWALLNHVFNVLGHDSFFLGLSLNFDYACRETQLLMFHAIGLNPFILILDDHLKHFTELTDMNHIGQEFMTDCNKKIRQMLTLKIAMCNILKNVTHNVRYIFNIRQVHHHFVALCELLFVLLKGLVFCWHIIVL